MKDRYIEKLDSMGPNVGDPYVIPMACSDFK